LLNILLRQRIHPQKNDLCSVFLEECKLQETETEIYKQGIWQLPMAPIRLKSQGHHVGLDFLMMDQQKKVKTMAGSWKQLNHPPPVAVDTMLLLTDGSVMCHDNGTPNWYKLAPDAYSDYDNGTWHELTPLPANAPISQNGPTNAPLYYASAVLRDGRVFVAGGEYNGSAHVDILAAQIYDPVADSWSSIPTPPGWGNIGDAPTCVLPDGRVLMGNITTVDTVLLDPVTKNWNAGGHKHDTSSEESWTLLPDGTIIVAEVNNHPHAEKYLIATNQWIAAGSTPPGHDLVLNEPGVSIEVGPAILMPDYRVFAIGATGHTTLYLPPLHPAQPGSWIPGPDFPADPSASGQLLHAFDAPACLLPNGNVLCVVGPLNPGIPSPSYAGWAGPPCMFFEFDGAALHPVPSPASATNTLTYDCRLLLLPTGQVLLSNCTNTIEIYTPAGGPHPAWRPHITSVPRHLHPGHSYRLHGRQLTGLSQAVAYGDDAQMATNYPLVRLLGVPSVGMVYCRTFDHSTMAVATGSAIHHTHFGVPPSLPHGDYELVVIANGITSDPVEVHIVPEEEKHEHSEPDRDHDEDGPSLTLKLKLPVTLVKQ
jgi:hypothetical protein